MLEALGFFCALKIVSESEKKDLILKVLSKGPQTIENALFIVIMRIVNVLFNTLPKGAIKCLIESAKKLF